MANDNNRVTKVGANLEVIEGNHYSRTTKVAANIEVIESIHYSRATKVAVMLEVFPAPPVISVTDAGGPALQFM